MVLNFGLAAGVMYATRKSKLPFKEKLRKLYEEKALLPQDLVLYHVPYFKIILVLALVAIQVWVHNVIQSHKQELSHHGLLANRNATISVSETSGASLNSNSRSLLLQEVVGHIALTLVSLVQILLIRVDRLRITKERAELRSFSLLGISKTEFQTGSIRDVRVIRRGRDRISHKTQKLSVRVYAETGERTS